MFAKEILWSQEIFSLCNLQGVIDGLRKRMIDNVENNTQQGEIVIMSQPDQIGYYDDWNWGLGFNIED